MVAGGSALRPMLGRNCVRRLRIARDVRARPPGKGRSMDHGGNVGPRANRGLPRALAFVVLVFGAGRLMAEPPKPTPANEPAPTEKKPSDDGSRPGPAKAPKGAADENGARGARKGTGRGQKARSTGTAKGPDQAEPPLKIRPLPARPDAWRRRADHAPPARTRHGGRKHR